MDSLIAKLMQSEDEIRDQKEKIKTLEEKLRQWELDVEAIPILKAQVNNEYYYFQIEKSDIF